MCLQWYVHAVLSVQSAFFYLCNEVLNCIQLHVCRACVQAFTEHVKGFCHPLPSPMSHYGYMVGSGLRADSASTCIWYSTCSWTLHQEWLQCILQWVRDALRVNQDTPLDVSSELHLPFNAIQSQYDTVQEGEWKFKGASGSHPSASLSLLFQVQVLWVLSPSQRKLWRLLMEVWGAARNWWSVSMM